ncbi:Six-hairpin glycosidase [Mycena indigotica]|uniref:Six-hairpin glycosidase n=1 Tax=Mycena indigotica TaxID=2126181 RepID=A0A8H6S129_9AGAR|nr:Six-hairpin glycosidase [Mycena indigotica]KAF7290698.1 Six-hairpin glycosidase [Mycena indigotica]
MLSSALFLVLSSVSFVAANGAGQPVRPGDIPGDIANVGNNRYTARMTFGHDKTQSVNVLLDTGSTDLWIHPAGGMKAEFTSTGVTHKITYGGGSYINGMIGLAEINIAGFTIGKQAFINASESYHQDLCNDANDVCGLVGLGFDSPKQGIQHALIAAGKDGASIGKSVLSNIYDANPTMPRLFGLSLSRGGDSAVGADEVSLAIGQCDPNYDNVRNMPKFPVYPPGALSWHILARGAQVNGQDIDWLANDASTPFGHHVIGLDSGTTNILLPPYIRDAVYSKVPGAALAKNSKLHNSHWSNDTDVWVIPCDTPVNFTMVFGQVRFNGDSGIDSYIPYHVHPLDMTDMYVKKGPDGKTYTICVGSATNGGSITSGKTDGLFGASFMRNVYSVFSFGDTINNTSPNGAPPYIQLLSKTNSAEWAAGDFAAVRGPNVAMSTRNAPELAPTDLIMLFDGKAPAMTGPSTSGSTPSRPNPGSGSSSGSQSCPTNFKNAAALSESSMGGPSSSMDKFIPVIVGLLVANLVVGLVVVAFSVLRYIRERRSVGVSRSSSLRTLYAPVMTREKEADALTYEPERPYSDRT